MHVVVVPLAVIAVVGPGVAAPAPAMLGKDAHHRTIGRDGVGIAVWLPQAAHQHLAIPNLIIFVGVDVNGGAAVMLAGGGVAPPGITADVVDGELLRVIINFGKCGYPF